MRLLFILLLFSTSCSISKIEKTTTITNIYFGSGGGVTGEIVEYHLTSKGDIFKNNKKIKVLNSKMTIQIFKKAGEIKDIQFFDANNTYSYLRIQKKDGSENKIVWNITSTDLKSGIKDLHEQLIFLSTN